MKAKWFLYGVLVIGWVWISGVIFLPPLEKLKKYTLRYEKLEKEISALKEEFRRLKKERRKLEEDPFYIETLARKELKMCRPGETIYRVR